MKWLINGIMPKVICLEKGKVNIIDVKKQLPKDIQLALDYDTVASETPPDKKANQAHMVFTEMLVCMKCLCSARNHWILYQLVICVHGHQGEQVHLTLAAVSAYLNTSNAYCQTGFKFNLSKPSFQFGNCEPKDILITTHHRGEIF